MLSTGCSLIPDRLHEPRFHNPFPQLSRVAVMPFFNQSGEPTLNGLAVANSYRNELQKIPGFEVMPVGVVEQLLLGHNVPINESTDFQYLARLLNVDAIIVGSVTDFSEYYPPRIGLAVNWYAANPCFHPIPPGYGLPWGTADEEFIPESLAQEAEFALAREQLKTQTPIPATVLERIEDSSPEQNEEIQPATFADRADPYDPTVWPDRHCFIPPPPSGIKPKCVPHTGPIIELVRQFNGNDAEFTRQLTSYYQFRNDERAGGWKGYLQRKDDFIQFCCYLHITELLAARGGAGETRVVWRWPNGR